MVKLTTCCEVFLMMKKVFFCFNYKLDESNNKKSELKNVSKKEIEFTLYLIKPCLLN